MYNAGLSVMPKARFFETESAQLSLPGLHDAPGTLQTVETNFFLLEIWLLHRNSTSLLAGAPIERPYSYRIIRKKGDGTQPPHFQTLVPVQRRHLKRK